MTEYPYTTNESSLGLRRRTFMKAAGAAGAVAAVGTTQAAVDEETDESIVVPQLENAPAELAIGLIIPHRRVGPDVDGGYHTASRWGIHFETSRLIHIEGVTIDAQRSGTSTAVLARYDGGSRSSRRGT